MSFSLLRQSLSRNACKLASRPTGIQHSLYTKSMTSRILTSIRSTQQRTFSCFGTTSFSSTPKATRRIHTSQTIRSDTVVPPPKEEPIIPPKAVGIWLMISSTLVLAIIVVGGVTRLTESGLSITEWRPITGVLPPLTAAQWDEEFTKYKQTPEFKLLNHSITVEEFKRIFYMEWGHRVLGRLLGFVFVGPLAYFAIKKKISKPLAWKLGGMAVLIGAQGLLGWYMVKSGLDDALMDTPGATPRVSQYRLAAHLGMAFALYVGMFATGLATIKEFKFTRSGLWHGLEYQKAMQLLSTSVARRFKGQAAVLTGLVFITALSGAFVAGLDAGLIYNEFPLMGGRLVPPTDELLSHAYMKGGQGMWRNFFENPTTVQFDHRCLAIGTYLGIAALYAQGVASRAVLSPAAFSAIRIAFAMANAQVALGICTLLYLVPVPLAATHQAGSVLLLTTMLHVMFAFRQPGKAALHFRNLHKLATTKRP